MRRNEENLKIQTTMCYRTETISSDSVEINKEYYYDINRRFLSWIGQWPYQKPKERLFNMTVLMLAEFSVLFTQIAQLVVCEDMQCLLKTIATHLLFWNVLVKILTCQFNSDKIKNLTHRLFVDWDMLKTREDYEIMKKYAENGRWYSLLYGSYVYVSTVSFVTTSLVPPILDIVFPLNYSRPLILAYPAYYFVDEERYFYYIFCYLLISGIICLTGLIAHDCIFFAFAEHVCGLFAVVGYRFEHLLHKHNYNEKKNLNNSLDASYCKNIPFLVHVHKEALHFATVLESTFSMSFALQFFITSAGLSVTLLQISTHLHDLPEAMRYAVYAIGELFHLFCFSFQGQKIIDHSLDTCNRIYNGSWYKIPASVQRLLLMVMMKSSKASMLTAGKIYVFSLENYTTLVQTSMSYFTVLSSYNES